MDTITIPKELATKGDLVILPRKKYEELLVLKRFREFKPTVVQKKALLHAEQNLSKRKTLSYHDLAGKLGLAG